MKVSIACIKETFLGSAEGIMKDFSDTVVVCGNTSVSADIDSERFSELKSSVNLVNAQIDESQDTFTLTRQ